jgi:2-oxoglutarate ferredoxin oxidoreductase subunit beta
VTEIEQHDGSILRLRKLTNDYDPTNRYSALSYVNEHQAQGEVVTGLLYIDPDATDLHTALNTCDQPLNSLALDKLCPGSDILSKINMSFR